MRRRAVVAASASVIAVIASGVTQLGGMLPYAAASPLDLFGQGAKSAGRAGAGAVTSVDGEALGSNPSGVAAEPDIAVSIGEMFGAIELVAGGESRPAQAPRGTTLTAIMPIRLNGWANKRFILGAKAFLPRENLVTLSYPGGETPAFTLLEQRTQMTELSATLSYALSPRLRVGAGASAVLSLNGLIILRSNGFGGLDTLADQSVLVDAAPLVGVQWDITSQLRVGGAYRGALAATYYIDFISRTEPSFPLPLPALVLQGVGQYEPSHFEFGVQWSPVPALRFFADVTYAAWGAYPRPAESITPDTLPALPRPNFADTVVPRAGLDVILRVGDGGRAKAMAFALRGGYSFVSSPAPDAPASQAILDNDRHVVGAGVGFSATMGGNRWYIDAWVQAQELAERRHLQLGADFTSDGSIKAGGVTIGSSL
ncbi:MAG: hypothetical protein IPL79_19720 [Myxococcales bacterium]|nr:hypothetical protein [Myxococcales bacterium]